MQISAAGKISKSAARHGSRLRLAMPQSYINDSEHWRDRARQMRELAAQVTNLETKKMMLGFAEDYDRLAEWAQQRRKRRSSKLP
jgi:hypothetical protein